VFSVAAVPRWAFVVKKTPALRNIDRTR